jgi:hypothetical protein
LPPRSVNSHRASRAAATLAAVAAAAGLACVSPAGAAPLERAAYERVVVSRETKEDAKRPARVVLSGKLPAGR